MEIKRGAVVVCVFPREYGKPRPAVVVQSDLFNLTHPSITVCPITSTRRDYPLFRIDVAPSKGAGLRKASQVMVDKIITIPQERIGKVVGELSDAQMQDVDTALRMWLGLS